MLSQFTNIKAPLSENSPMAGYVKCWWLLTNKLISGYLHPLGDFSKKIRALAGCDFIGGETLMELSGYSQIPLFPAEAWTRGSVSNVSKKLGGIIPIFRTEVIPLQGRREVFSR